MPLQPYYMLPCRPHMHASCMRPDATGSANTAMVPLGLQSAASAVPSPTRPQPVAIRPPKPKRRRLDEQEVGDCGHPRHVPEAALAPPASPARPTCLSLAAGNRGKPSNLLRSKSRKTLNPERGRRRCSLPIKQQHANCKHRRLPPLPPPRPAGRQYGRRPSCAAHHAPPIMHGGAHTGQTGLAR